MTTIEECLNSRSRISRFANHLGGHRSSISRWEMKRFILSVGSSTPAAAVFMIVLAPIVAADPTAHLKSEIDAARTASGCPPLQLDPLLNDVSHTINRENDEYVRHAADVLPATGDVELSRVLREAGSNPIKARLLSGYGDHRVGGTGDNEAKAIKATVLQGLGLEVLPDCTYTKYGLNTINDDSSQGWPSTAPRSFTVTTVVVTGA
jgi:hypothetical protein